MNKNVITCKLTDERGLGIKSHIIPKSFYFFDKNNHKPGALIKLNGDDTKISRSPVGEYDDKIVTAKGEAFFSSGDTYALDCLVRREQGGYLYQDGSEPLCIEIADFDYNKLKMFFLSLLWRAGVTKRPLFRHVNLGTHESIIEQMILSNDPGEPDDYSVILATYKDTPPHGFPMLEPTKIRDIDTQVVYYRFSLGHFVAFIKVDKRPYDAGWQDFVISPNLPLRYLMLDDFRTTDLYKSIRLEVQKKFKKC